MKMVSDGEGLDETTEAQWKRTGRIVDGALTLKQDGNFPEMPLHMPLSDDAGTNGVAPNTPFTVVPGVITRGREPISPPAAAGSSGVEKRTAPPPPPVKRNELPTDVRAWKLARLDERNRRLGATE